MTPPLDGATMAAVARRTQRYRGKPLIDAMLADVRGRRLVAAKERAAIATKDGFPMPSDAELEDALRREVSRYQEWAHGADRPEQVAERAAVWQAAQAIAQLREACAAAPELGARLRDWVAAAPEVLAEERTDTPMRRLISVMVPMVPGPGEVPPTNRYIADVAMLAGIVTDTLVRGGMTRGERDRRDLTLAEGWRSLVACVHKARIDLAAQAAEHRRVLTQRHAQGSQSG